MEDKSIIIKKVKKISAGAHGGSWKVAFADFMTGMMAFFLLMWLVNMTPPQKKEELAKYFQEYSLFAEGGAGGSAEIIAKEQAATEAQITVTQAPAAAGGAADSEASSAGLERFKEQLQQEIEQRLADLKEQVSIQVVEGGVKVDIMDKEGNPMFPLGSTTLTESGQRILKVLCDNIKNTTNRIEIEGHTDAVSYAKKEFGNWELSTARASAARVEVEKNGIPPNRLLRVSGYAATEPIIKENPFDPRNRRISLRLYPNKSGTPPAQPQPQTQTQAPQPQAPAQVAPQVVAPQNAPLVQPTRMK